ETAYQLAKKNKNLILTARRVEKLKKIKDKCEKIGIGKIYVFPMDLSSVTQIDQLDRFIANNNIQIEVLINNAGFGYAGSFVKMSDKKIEELFRVNVLGLMYLTQRIAISMLDYGKGQIINLASLAGKVATADFAVYAATKAAVIAFSNALRLELKKHGINITLINFGPVDSPFFNKITGHRRKQSLNSPFILKTEAAAKQVVRAVGKNIREINRPLLLAFGAKLYSIAPALVDQVLLSYFRE
ncbi:MAG: SDR family NAD(P)-dependent oxidoreductase, partial [Atopostipes suicloacalis]|nr:SDR family NAD(P)-dependent oxidoreductase [Atopostipes suicloacalis]